MKKQLILIALILLAADTAFAQSQKQMLYSKDPKFEANKRLVYDFWRKVLEGGHLELAENYLTESYIQHNPNVPTGRRGFIDFFSKFAHPVAIKDTIQSPLIAIVAEGDRVVLSFRDVRSDPKDTTKTYTTTSFEMLRIEHGKIAEHWDNATR